MVLLQLSRWGRFKKQWRRGWIEIPEIMGSGGLAILGGCLGLYSYFRIDRSYGWNHKYVQKLMVIRPDDPRVPKLQKYSPWD